MVVATYRDTDMSRVTAKVDRPMHGANLEAHLDALRTQMRKAAVWAVAFHMSSH